MTNWLFAGSYLLVFSYSLDVLDEVLSYPENVRLMSWLESFPAPLGMVLFVLARISKLSVERATMAILPWLIPLLLGLVAITYIPALTLWLPQQMGLLK